MQLPRETKVLVTRGGQDYMAALGDLYAEYLDRCRISGESPETYFEFQKKFENCGCGECGRILGKP